MNRRLSRNYRYCGIRTEQTRNDDATDSDTDDESEAATDVNAKGNSWTVYMKMI